MADIAIHPEKSFEHVLPNRETTSSPSLSFWHASLVILLCSVTSVSLVVVLFIFRSLAVCSAFIIESDLKSHFFSEAGKKNLQEMVTLRKERAETLLAFVKDTIENDHTLHLTSAHGCERTATIEPLHLESRSFLSAQSPHNLREPDPEDTCSST